MEGTTPPLVLVGCQRTSNDSTFRNFAVPDASLDELAIWTRRLVRKKVKTSKKKLLIINLHHF